MKIVEQYRFNKPISLQVPKAVDWQSIRSLLQHMSTGSCELLMVASYVVTTLSRVDFTPYKIVRSETVSAKCELSGVN